MKALHVGAVTVASVAALGLVAGYMIWLVLLNEAAKPLPPPERIPLDWWKHCTLYQIFPRSFKDSDGDGIGDLKGILSELEHFVDAGVDAIWLSPIFESPMVDFGYDISNFYGIHYEYGTMEDFDNILERAHELGLKVLLDFVPNHASTKSEYFIRSVARDPKYKDFFVWADPLPDPKNKTNRLPPSNWISLFDGSAWEWNEHRQQYYLHQFAIQQADFDFRNQAVKHEMHNIMEFWLDKGVDGFRVDATRYLLEADPADHEGRYPDEPLSLIAGIKPLTRGYNTQLYTTDLIELYDIVYEWREFVDKYKETKGGDTRVLFIEAYTNISMTMLYYGNETGAVGAHLPFNFDFIMDLSAKSNARDFVYTILKWLTYMPHGAVPNWVFGNHDRMRMATRFKTNMVDGLNALDMMLPGVAVTYQGDEIGMRDGYVSFEDTVDVYTSGDPNTFQLNSRDPARTPFHWNNSTSAGFSTSNSTWLPVAQDFMELNLAKQKEDERSHFKVYQALTKLRKETTLIHGNYDVQAFSLNSLYLERSLRTFDTLALVFNVGEVADTVDLGRVPHLKLPVTVYVSSVHSNRRAGTEINEHQVTLQPGEALVLRAQAVK